MSNSLLKLLVLLAFSLSQGCKKEIACISPCGYLQTCEEGNCKCPENYHQLGSKCEPKNANYYFGKLPCGCFDEFIINLNLIELNKYDIIMQSSSPSGQFIENGNNIYKFYMPSECIVIEGNRSNFVTFEIERQGDLLQVNAKWWDVETGKTLEECSAVFRNK